MHLTFRQKFSAEELVRIGWPIAEVTSNIEANITDGAKFQFDRLLEGDFKPTVTGDSIQGVEGRFDMYMISQQDYNRIRALLGELSEVLPNERMKAKCRQVLEILNSDQETQTE